MSFSIVTSLFASVAFPLFFSYMCHFFLLYNFQVSLLLPFIIAHVAFVLFCFCMCHLHQCMCHFCLYSHILRTPSHTFLRNLQHTYMFYLMLFIIITCVGHIPMESVHLFIIVDTCAIKICTLSVALGDKCRFIVISLYACWIWVLCVLLCSIHVMHSLALLFVPLISHIVNFGILTCPHIMCKLWTSLTFNPMINTLCTSNPLS